METRSESLFAQAFHKSRYDVPVVPLALVTDAWGNGRWIKEFGKIHIDREVHFAFGEPIAAPGRGSKAHDQVVVFIRRMLAEWE